MRADGLVKGKGSDTIFFDRAKKKWFPISDADMGHRNDAVKYWNKTGRHHRPKSKPVRAWMLKPDNYELQHYNSNRSSGAKLKDRYRDPPKRKKSHARESEYHSRKEECMLAGDPIENEWFDRILPLAENNQHEEIIKITLSYWDNIPEPKLEKDFSYHLIYKLFYSHLKLKKFEEAKIWLEQFEGFNYKKADRYDGGEFEIAKGNYLWETNKPEEAIQSWGLADKKTKGQCFRSVQAQLAKSIYKKIEKKGESPSEKKPKVTKKEIKKICELGSEHMEKNDFAEAETCFTKALELLPDPAADHEFYHWIMASLGDACLSQNKLKESESHLLEGKHSVIPSPQDLLVN